MFPGPLQAMLGLSGAFVLRGARRKTPLDLPKFRSPWCSDSLALKARSPSSSWGPPEAGDFFLELEAFAVCSMPLGPDFEEESRIVLEIQSHWRGVSVRVPKEQCA